MAVGQGHADSRRFVHGVTVDFDGGHPTCRADLQKRRGLMFVFFVVEKCALVAQAKFFKRPAHPPAPVLYTKRVNLDFHMCPPPVFGREYFSTLRFRQQNRGFFPHCACEWKKGVWYESRTYHPS